MKEFSRQQPPSGAIRRNFVREVAVRAKSKKRKSKAKSRNSRKKIVQICADGCTWLQTAGFRDRGTKGPIPISRARGYLKRDTVTKQCLRGDPLVSKRDKRSPCHGSKRDKDNHLHWPVRVKAAQK